MQDYDLPQIAIDELIRLSKEVGSPIEDRPEFQILWDERLIMGGDVSTSPNAAFPGCSAAAS